MDARVDGPTGREARGPRSLSHAEPCPATAVRAPLELLEALNAAMRIRWCALALQAVQALIGAEAVADPDRCNSSQLKTATLRAGSILPSLLERRRRVDQACLVVEKPSSTNGG